MSFLTGLWGKVAGYAAIAGAVLLVLIGVRQGGKDAVRALRSKEDAEAANRAAKVDSYRDPSDLDKRLRDGSF